MAVTLPPGALEFKRFVDYVKAHRALPTNLSVNGNFGVYHEITEDFIRTFEKFGYDGFMKSLESVLNAKDGNGKPHFKDVYVAIAAAPEQEEESDPRTTKATNGKTVFVVRSRKDLKLLPRPQYLVNRLLHTLAVTLLYGDSNTGKTFWALHLSLCISLGIEWYGRKVKQGKTLYIFTEGASSLDTRLEAWEHYYGRKIGDEIGFMTFPAHLVEERTTLIDTIADMPEKPALLVIDTYSNCTSGMNQNDQSDVEKALATAHEINRTFGCHVLVVHHTNLSGKFNGSMAFKNHCDTMIELKKENEDSPIFMRCEKQRDIEPFEPIKLALEVLDLGIDAETYEPITSCVIVPSQTKTYSESKREEDCASEQSQMIEILQMHKRLTTRQWISECKSVGISQRGFYSHLPQLKMQNLIVAEEKKGAIYFEVALEATSRAQGESNE